MKHLKKHVDKQNTLLSKLPKDTIVFQSYENYSGTFGAVQYSGTKETVYTIADLMEQSIISTNVTLLEAKQMMNELYNNNLIG